MTTPACSPEFPWACPPGIREQMERAASVDEKARQRESGAWFDEWKKRRDKPFPALTSLEDQPLRPNVRVVDKVDNFFDSRLFQVNDVVDKVDNFFDSRLFQVNDVATVPKVVIDPAPDRLRDDVATPPPGVETSWGPGVSPPWQKNPEEALDEAVKRLEEQRRREAELFERLDQLKSTWPAVPRLFELPGLWVIPKLPELSIRPLPIILPVKRLGSETRRKVPA